MRNTPNLICCPPNLRSQLWERQSPCHVPGSLRTDKQAGTQWKTKPPVGILHSIHFEIAYKPWKWKVKTCGEFVTVIMTGGSTVIQWVESGILSTLQAKREPHKEKVFHSPKCHHHLPFPTHTHHHQLCSSWQCELCPLICLLLIMLMSALRQKDPADSRKKRAKTLAEP